MSKEPYLLQFQNQIVVLVLTTDILKYTTLCCHITNLIEPCIFKNVLNIVINVL